jgi:uncharacterized protein (TIGR00255 family)
MSAARAPLASSAERTVRRTAIQSMTGYGRASQHTPVGTVGVELRSTNHRYLDVASRLPNGLAALEGRLVELVRGGIQRGRVDLSVTLQPGRQAHRQVALDEWLLERYHAALVELKARFGLKGPVTMEQLLALPQAISIVEERMPVERLWDAIRRAAQAAVRELVRARQREGARLVADVRAQLRAIERHALAVRRRLPKALERQRHRLRKRLEELLGRQAQVMTPQLEQAAALAREADIHEELVRLDSHLDYMRQTIASQTLVGKRLDFIAQELMREANTMGAKADDPVVAHHVVDIKGCIEKIREQVQNLE